MIELVSEGQWRGYNWPIGEQKKYDHGDPTKLIIALSKILQVVTCEDETHNHPESNQTSTQQEQHHAINHHELSDESANSWLIAGTA